MTISRWLSQTLQDLRFAFREYSRRPGAGVLAVLTLAFGIGATTAVYSLVHAVLLRPLPFADADRLMMVWDNAPQDGDRFKAIMVSRDDVEEYAKSSQTMERFSSAGRIFPTLRYSGVTKPVLGGLVTTAMFRDTLGSAPMLGRTFTDGDLQSGCAVVLAHGFWTRELQADTSLVGKDLTFDDTPCAVLGVMPVGFDLFPIGADMWFLRDHAPRQAVELARRGEWLNDGIVYARLKPDSSPEQVEKELTAVHRRLHASDPPSEGGERGRVAAVTPVRSAIMGVTSPSLSASLWLAFGAVALLLLIACVNVANLLLARLADRQRELTVRAALGSGRARLIRQLMAEGLVLAAGGTLIGVPLAWAGVRWFRYLNPIDLPTQAGEVGLNPRILLFAIVTSALTAMLFSLFPALAGSAVDVSQSLRAAGRGFFGRSRQRRFTQALVALEMALTFLLLAGAGLLMSSVLYLESEQLGFDVGGIVTARAEMLQRYPTRESRDAFERTLQQRLRTIPGVADVAFGDFPPNVDGGESQLEVQGQPVEKVFDVDVREASRDYFDVLRVPVLRGRMFEKADDRGPAIAIVSQRLADEYFRGQNPVGRVIRVINGDVQGEWRTVVGVIGSWKHLVGEAAWRETPVVFTAGGKPRKVDSGYGITIGVRSSASTSGMPQQIQREIAKLDPNAVIRDADALSDRLGKMTVFPRFRAALLTIFGAVALLLSAVGIYGVVAQLVAQRIPEFGLRRAVGAQGRDLAWLVMRQGGASAAVGLVVGVVAALSGTRVVQGLLYGVVPTEPLIYGMACAVLAAGALLAMLFPVLRAVRVNPMMALRQE